MDISREEAPLSQIDVLFPPNPDSSRILVEMGSEAFMASRIAHAVEDADARLLNMNVTSLSHDSGRLVVALRVDHRNPERVARSLERYGYNIINIDSTVTDDDTVRRRYDELMRYLSL